MPETRVPVPAAFALAETRRVGPGWQQKPGVNDRADVGLNLPLVDPRFQPSPDDAAALAARTPAQAPTEATQRQMLADALAARDMASGALVEAQEAHGRALAHQRLTRGEVDRYAGLAGRIDDHMTDAMRDGVPGSLPEALRMQISERGIAEAEHEAAARVVGVLNGELEQAREAHQRTEQAVTYAISGLIATAKEPLRVQVEQAERRLEALRQAVELGPHSPVWSPVRDGLLADPLTASLAVEIGDAPLALPGRAGVFVDGPKIISIMRGDGTVEHLSELEFMNRERAAQMAAEAARELPGTREERARARSRQQFAG